MFLEGMNYSKTVFLLFGTSGALNQTPGKSQNILESSISLVRSQSCPPSGQNLILLLQNQRITVYGMMNTQQKKQK